MVTMEVGEASWVDVLALARMRSRVACMMGDKVACATVLDDSSLSNEDEEDRDTDFPLDMARQVRVVRSLRVVDMDGSGKELSLVNKYERCGARDRSLRMFDLSQAPQGTFWFSFFMMCVHVMSKNQRMRIT